MRGVALLAVMHAAGLHASGNVPVVAAWVADPDDQFLLDVNIRDLRLGDGVRAYKAPEGTCIILGDFLTTLDVPMTIDPSAGAASGWAFAEKNRIVIDRGAARATFGKSSEAIAPGTIRDTAEGWCVQASALSRWFGIGVRPLTSGSVLRLESEMRLPVELARLRQIRANAGKPAKLDIADLPRVSFPYRMWRTPTVDVFASAGLTHRPGIGARFDRQMSVYSAGEFARMSFESQLTTDRRGLPSNARFTLFRSDPDGGLLGPAHATHVGIGDVEGFASKLSGTAAFGRGAVISNRPVAALTAFDKSHFEGDLPAGWEAEIYRNNELLGFARSSAEQRYTFDNIQLLYGENRIRIVLYGPQGQIREREEIVDVGHDSAPPGRLWYWAGVSQPGQDMLRLHRPPEGGPLPRGQATLALEYGIDKRTSVAAVTRAIEIDQQRLLIAEATIRRSIGLALAEVGAAKEAGGGTAARAQLLGKIGPAYINAEGVIASNFHLHDSRPETRRDYRVGIDIPFKLGKQDFPTHADVRLTKRDDGSKNLEATTKFSANISRFNLSAIGRYERDYGTGLHGPDRFTVSTLGSGRIGRVRVRALSEFEVSPAKRFRTSEVSAYWSGGRNVDWETGVAFDAIERRTRARVSHIRRFDGFGIALTGEAASDGSVAVGISLNFSIDPGAGMRFSRRPLAQGGIVRATVYRDLNGNGVRDTAEPPEPDAVVTTASHAAERPTDKSGQVSIDGLAPYTPVVVAIDESSLSDPRLAISNDQQVVVPRRGIASEVEIGLVGGGDIEGSVVKDGGLGFEGLDLELVDRSGKVVATTRSDFDGFFLFERVAYGHYAVRVAAASAEAAKVDRDLGLTVEISAEKSVARVGSMRVRPTMRLAPATASH
jgi:hypothetical protein